MPQQQLPVAEVQLQVRVRPRVAAAAHVRVLAAGGLVCLRLGARAARCRAALRSGSQHACAGDTPSC
jgi:hypothetical protein